MKAGSIFTSNRIAEVIVLGAKASKLNVGTYMAETIALKHPIGEERVNDLVPRDSLQGKTFSIAASLSCHSKM